MEMTSKLIQKYKAKSQPQLKALAKVWFNRFIRLRDSEDNVFVCCSCHHAKTGDQMNAGHFYSGGHNGAIEFDERNVNGQCIHCNLYEHGNLIGYTEFMLNHYGQSVLDELEVKRNLPFKPNRFYFIEIIEIYKEKCNKIKNN